MGIGSANKLGSIQSAEARRLGWELHSSKIDLATVGEANGAPMYCQEGESKSQLNLDADAACLLVSLGGKESGLYASVVFA